MRQKFKITILLMILSLGSFGFAQSNLRPAGEATPDVNDLKTKQNLATNEPEHDSTSSVSNKERMVDEGDPKLSNLPKPKCPTGASVATNTGFSVGDLYHVYCIRADKLDGEYFVTKSDGTIREKRGYIDGEPDGTFTLFAEDGGRTEMDFDHGIRKVVRSYNKMGKTIIPDYKTAWELWGFVCPTDSTPDVKYPDSSAIDKAGTEVKICKKDGQSVDPALTYFVLEQNGRLRESRKYVGGKADGTFVLFEADGTRTEMDFDHDLRKVVRSYNSKGEKIAPDYKKAWGLWGFVCPERTKLTFYRNDDPRYPDQVMLKCLSDSADSPAKDNFYFGRALEWNNKTSRPVALSIVNDKHIGNGPFQTFSATGELDAVGFRKDGHVTGLASEYRTDGKKMSEGEFEDDKKIGVWTLWDENGKVRKETAAQRAALEKIALEKERQQAKKREAAERIAAAAAKVAATAAKAAHDAKAAADKEAREKATEARKEKAAERAEERQKEMVCRCRQYLETLETNKNFETRVGQSSGYEDKVKLHQLGVLSVTVSDYLDVLNAKYPDVACEKQFTIYKQAECVSEAANLRAKLSGD